MKPGLNDLDDELSSYIDPYAWDNMGRFAHVFGFRTIEEEIGL